jgi:hypothetical protein
MKISASITDYTWPGGTAALGGELERVARAAGYHEEEALRFALRDLGLDHVVVITPAGWTPKGIGIIAAGLEV